MVHNTATPLVDIEPGTGPVLVDGQAIGVHRAETLPLTRLHHRG